MQLWHNGGRRSQLSRTLQSTSGRNAITVFLYMLHGAVFCELPANERSDRFLVDIVNCMCIARQNILSKFFCNYHVCFYSLHTYSSYL